MQISLLQWEAKSVRTSNGSAEIWRELPLHCAFLQFAIIHTKWVEKSTSVLGRLCSVWPPKYVKDGKPFKCLLSAGKRRPNSQSHGVWHKGVLGVRSQTKKGKDKVIDFVWCLSLLRVKQRSSCPFPTLQWPDFPDLAALHRLFPGPQTLFPQFITSLTLAVLPSGFSSWDFCSGMSSLTYLNAHPL